MSKPRAYQERAIRQIHEAWNSGARRICLVIPTGGGKTFTADLATRGSKVLWLVHRRELVHQAPGPAVTIQKLLASGERPEADILIADECQHLAPAAEQWNSVAEHYPKILGLTATPQRGDGSPLGDLFDQLVVGANYSELIKGGWLVKAKVFRPTNEIEGSGLAQDPIAAYKKIAPDDQGFAYFSRVKLAERFAASFDPEGQLDLLNQKVDIITAKTPEKDRDDIIRRFRMGQIQVLSNVFTLTEGVDIPAAKVCLLARGCEHQGTYLQMVGRVLRPAPGKDHAIVIDLPGATHKHGLPTEDRIYSLTGRPIRAKLEPIRNCPTCGYVQPSATVRCERCGYEWPIKLARKPRIWDMPLEEAVAQAVTGRERGIAKWRKKQAEKSPAEKRKEWYKLAAMGQAKGYKPGWAKIQYKLRFGEWPHRGITG